MRGMAIGIAGAGLLGRLLAWRLSRLGHRVTVFDPGPGPEPRFDGQGAAGFSAAGMLSPLAEMENAGPEVAELGWRSIARWQAISGTLSARPFFAQRGSLLLAHRSDLGVAQRVLARLAGADVRALQSSQLAELEPAVQGPAHAWFLAGEAQIDPVATLVALQVEAAGATWRWNTRVTRLAPGALHLDDGSVQRFDLVFDVRGVGAAPDLPVRGVRGEIIWLHAPGHGLQRAARLLHPRHRVYIVPRPGDLLVVGASELESEDRSRVSLRSAVELMAAAHSVLPCLAEARILRMDRNLRPALPDNLPRTEVLDGLVRINGLFRHGWLLAPALVDDALAACHCEAAPQAAEVLP
jgi:glycine oxidase